MKQVLASFILLVFSFHFISCSKRDVVQDEPLVSPSDAGGTSSGNGSATSEAVPATDITNNAEAGTNSNLKTIFFEYDSYRITGEAKETLQRNAKWLKENKNVQVQIEGHCDERGTTEYNLALGERRANAVRDFLLKSGIGRSRVSVISYGEERPLDPGHTEEAYSKNRRAQFVVTSE